MSKSKAKVACIAAEREAQEAKQGFLGLLHEDMASAPEKIQPIPAPLLSRMAALRAKAKANRERNEPLEM